MIEKIYNDLEDYIEYNFNYIPISQLDRNKDFGKIYSIYTPNELITEYKILLNYKKGITSRETKNHLIEKATDKKDIRREKYNCKYNNNIKFYNAYTEEYEELLKKNNLPTPLNLHDVVSLSSNHIFDTDNSVISNNKEFQMLCSIINDWFNNKKLKELMPFKEFGKYEDYTPSLFLTLYKIYTMSLEGKLDGIKAQYLFNVCDEINKINNSDIKNNTSVQTIYKVCFDELEKYGLPVKFDLNTIVTLYGEVNTYQKTK